MKGAMGLLLVGGGIFLLIAIFNGSISGGSNPLSGLTNAIGQLFSQTTPASLQHGINPSPTTGTTGGVKNINPTVTTPSGKKVVCPVGTVYDPSSGKCVNVYQGNR